MKLFQREEMPELQNGSTVEPVNAEFWLGIVFSHDLGAALAILSSPCRQRFYIRPSRIVLGGTQRLVGHSKVTFLESSSRESCGCVGQGQALRHWEVSAFVLLLELLRAVPSQGLELLGALGAILRQMPLFLLTFEQSGECSGCQWGEIQLAQSWIRTPVWCKEWGISVLWNAGNCNISKYFCNISHKQWGFKLYLKRLDKLEALIHPTEIKAL